MIDTITVIRRLAETTAWRRAEYAPDGTLYRDSMTGEPVIRLRTAVYKPPPAA